MPIDTGTTSSTNRLIMEELSYDRAVLQEEADHMYSMLNEEQQHIFQTIITSISENKRSLYFISGFGGTVTRDRRSSLPNKNGDNRSESCVCRGTPFSDR
ncbi:unnamed protein product [Urochloa humidicola]